MRIEYTREFKRNLRQLAKRYRSIRSDIDPVIEQLKAGETPGDQITGTSYTLYKVRVKNSDNQRGKSSGYRVIYYLKTEGNVVLVTLYSKADQADVSASVLRRIVREYSENPEKQ